MSSLLASGSPFLCIVAYWVGSYESVTLKDVRSLRYGVGSACGWRRDDSGRLGDTVVKCQLLLQK